MYFNVFDPERKIGGWFRLANRPNEGRGEMSCCIYLPDGRIGFSDHSRGIEAACAAVVLGAEIIEKHFTYHVDMPGDDHAGAMTPLMLKEMTHRFERIETILGSQTKKPLEAEAVALSALRVDLGEVDF